MPVGGRAARPGRHERAGEAEPGGLGQPPADAGDRAHLAGQADLADATSAGRQRLVRGGAGDGERDRQVGRRLGQPDAADGRGVDVGLAQP